MIIWILRPLIPPAALTALKYALAPLAASANVDDALPVTEVMKPTLTVSVLTPGALALLPDVPPEVPPVLPATPVVAEPPLAAVVADDEVFELLLHPAAASAASAAAATNILFRVYTMVPLGCLLPVPGR